MALTPPPPQFMGFFCDCMECFMQRPNNANFRRAHGKIEERLRENWWKETLLSCHPLTTKLGFSSWLSATLTRQQSRCGAGGRWPVVPFYTSHLALPCWHCQSWAIRGQTSAAIRTGEERVNRGIVPGCHRLSLSTLLFSFSWFSCCLGVTLTLSFVRRDHDIGFWK